MNISSFDEFWKSIGEDKMNAIIQNNLSAMLPASMPSTPEDVAALMTKTATYAVLVSRDLLEAYHTWLQANIQEATR